MHWNAPPIAKSKRFCIKALQHHFGDGWRTAFVHSNDRDHHGAAGGARKRKAFYNSAVVQRELEKKSKLGFMSD